MQWKGSSKKKCGNAFSTPIIFKELRIGPRTRISKMENAGIHHAVGRCWLINYYCDSGLLYYHSISLIIYIFFIAIMN